MNTIKDGGAAFPRSGNDDCTSEFGMTLRDYFAGQVMNAMISGDAQPYVSTEQHADGITLEGVTASRAYQYADAMIAAREATP